MKKLLSVALVCILTLAAVSCSTEESVVMNDEESSVQKLPREHYVNLWSSHNKSSITRGVLFEYASKEEAALKADAATLAVEKDFRDNLSNVVGAVEVVSNIRIFGGKGILTDFHYVDSRGDVLESHVYNPSTDDYDVVAGGVGDFFYVAFGACPQGYTSLAFCLYGDDFGDCMGDAQQEFVTDNLVEEGDCINLQVSVAATGMQVCGKTC